MSHSEGNESPQAVPDPAGQGQDEGVCGEDCSVSDGNESTDRKETHEEEAAPEEPEVLNLSVGSFISKACSEKFPGVFVAAADQIVEAGRQNDSRPAYISFGVPDEFVKNLTGYAQLRDMYFFLRIPREFYEREARLSREPNPGDS